MGVIFTALCFILNAWFGVTGLMWVQAITDTLSCLIAVVLYERFKKSIAAELTQDTQAAKECQSTSNRVIVISREFGSGGRTIGKKVAIKLGIPCCDSDLIEKISMETGLAKEYVEKMQIIHSRPVFMIMQCQLENRMDNLFQTRCGWHRKSCHRPCKKRFLRNCWALCRLYFAGYCGLHDRVYPRLRREKGRAHCYCIRRKRGISRAATA